LLGFYFAAGLFSGPVVAGTGDALVGIFFASATITGVMLSLLIERLGGGLASLKLTASRVVSPVVSPRGRSIGRASETVAYAVTIAIVVPLVLLAGVQALIYTNPSA
jgi:hypothetical protein